MDSRTPTSAPPRRFQFGILHILIVTTIVAVLLWAVPWFESSPWVAVWVNLFIGAVFAGFGVYMSAAMLGLMFAAAASLFRRSEQSFASRLGAVGGYLFGFVLIAWVAIAMPFDIFVDNADALGGFTGWLIVGGAVVGLIAFAIVTLTFRAALPRE